MAQTYDKTNSGAIFINTNRKSDTHPDRTGSLDVEGVDYWISGWMKKDKEGKPYLSLSIKPKEEQPRQSSAPTRKSKNDDFDVPF